MAIDINVPPISGHSDLLCVLGMHRSGTSAVAQFLHRLGADVAPHLLEAMKGVNQDGFWEDQYVVELNERLLSIRGFRWYDSFESLVARDECAEAQIRSEAIGYFKKNYATKTLSVVKDPRLCRVLPFWLDVWSVAAVNPFFIHVVRHPFAVAKSLQRRDKIPYEYGVVLWLLHTIEAMLYTNAYAGLVVVYDEFLQYPLKLAEAVVSRYCAAMPGAGSPWLDAMNKAIKPDLRHNDNTIDAPLGLRDLQIFAVSLYETISVSNHGDVTVTQLEQWRIQLQQLLTHYTDEMSMLNRLCADLMSMSAESVRIGELHSAALVVIQSKDAAITYRDEVIAEKDALIADRNQFIRDLFHLKFWRLVPRIMRKVKKI
jgi:hypothetical protein